MCKTLTHLVSLVLAFGLMGVVEAAYDTVGVYDIDDAPHHNQVDQSGTYSSHTGDAGPENVIDLAAFQTLIGPAFNANAGGVVNLENANGSLDGQDIIAKFGVGKAKSLTISSISGIINTGSSVKEGRTPISGTGRLAKTDTANFLFAIGALKGGQPGEVVTYFAGTLLGRDGANLAPKVTATFSGGGTVTAVATMSGVPLGKDQDTFFGFVAPPGQSIVKVDFNPTGGPYTNLDDVAFITSAFVVVSQAATSPNPGNGQVDVPCDAVLRWAPGGSAKAHDVYFGTAFADVNTAGRTSPKGVLVSQGQEAATYDPGRLAFGQTYYWRVDEVNAPPGSVIGKGSVWSFTVESYGYPIKNVTATASSAQEGMGPERTVDGSGLNSLDQHSTEPKDMWLSGGVKPNWIRYEFDKTYELGEMRVWNSNQMIEPFMGFGAKNVKVEYSVDSVSWTEPLSVPEFARATGTPAYTANTTVKFGGVLAKYVKLTINSTWGTTPQSGLSEVRFLYFPVQAREPQPALAATGVGLDVILNWRPGRKAASHRVYFGMDKQAVTDGTATAQTVADHTFSPSGLLLSTTYYWRVDEVNEAAATKSWAGEVWSFTTADSVVVEDFESYTDNEGSRIYETWVDGFGSSNNGSQVGNTTAPFAGQTIVHGGRQSMPLTYSNSGAIALSEAVRTFATPQNWTAGGIKNLSLYFQGVAGNTGQLYLKINTTKVLYSGAAGDLAKPAWTLWNIDLSALGGSLASVSKLTIGIEGSGAKGVVYIDDIRLSPKTP